MAVILLIDDDEQFRVMLRQMLARDGHEVVEASDGNEGMKIFKERQMDLVVTDIIMPEKEGNETILELRRICPEVNIIAISGGGRLDPAECLFTAKAFGARYTFTKPIDRAKMLAAVKELLM